MSQIPKYKIGDKVVPISKTGQFPSKDPWDVTTDVGKEGKSQGFLYIIRHRVPNDEFPGPGYSCNSRSDITHGNFYNESDLIPYIEKPSIAIRINILLERYRYCNFPTIEGSLINLIITELNLKRRYSGDINISTILAELRSNYSGNDNKLTKLEYAFLKEVESKCK